MKNILQNKLLQSLITPHKLHTCFCEDTETGGVFLIGTSPFHCLCPHKQKNAFDKKEDIFFGLNFH